LKKSLGNHPTIKKKPKKSPIVSKVTSKPPLSVPMKGIEGTFRSLPLFASEYFHALTGKNATNGSKKMSIVDILSECDEFFERKCQRIYLCWKEL